MKTYNLSCNLEGHMDDTKFGSIVISTMPFIGTKEFYPVVRNEALFFKALEGSRVSWWHGWLKGIPFMQGIIRGYQVQLLDCEGSWINVETPEIVACHRCRSEIIFCSVSIDIGGEELAII